MKRYWPLLLPATYLAHIAEEYFGGFPVWASHFLKFHLTDETFLTINAVAWLLMLFASVISIRLGLLWLMVPFATAIFINGWAHVIMSTITRSYSPGVVTGLLLWIPLGTATLAGSYRHISHRLFWIGVAMGIFLHLIVTLNAVKA